MIAYARPYFHWNGPGRWSVEDRQREDEEWMERMEEGWRVDEGRKGGK